MLWVRLKRGWNIFPIWILHPGENSFSHSLKFLGQKNCFLVPKSPILCCYGCIFFSVHLLVLICFLLRKSRAEITVACASLMQSCMQGSSRSAACWYLSNCWWEGMGQDLSYIPKCYQKHRDKPCKFAVLLLLPSGKNICLVICLEPKGCVTAYCLEINTGERYRG